MASLNRITLIGNLGRDPELRSTHGGRQVAEFSIATSERWKDRSGEQQERTEWHRVVVWGPQAELAAKYLTKGRSVCVEGRIQYRDWTDKEGNKRTTAEIVASNVVFLASGGGRSESSGGDYLPTSGKSVPCDDEIPF